MSEHLRVIDAREDESAFAAFLKDRAGAVVSAEVSRQVAEILEAVRREGDQALVRLERQFDCPDFTLERIRVSDEEIAAAYEQVPPSLLAALRRAIENVRAYHEREVPHSWRAKIGGLILGSRVRPLESAGIYVPGGQAPLPSSLYMCAGPATVAGVRRIAMCSPPRADGSVHPLILVTAKECGVAEVYRLGGAQAVAALAYGTETVAPVVKVVGPGSRWVIEAKRQVFGVVGIESLPGPSESAIIADSEVVLFTPSPRLAEAVLAEIPAQAAALERADLIARSLREQGALVLVRDLPQAAALASALAPEHLELAVEYPEALAERIENAGCIFLGHLAAVPLGDYAAGPSHVLPTGGTARFSSPLSVHDFLKRTSLVEVTEQGLRRIGPDTLALAEAEGLTAHAAAVRKRLEG